MRAGHVPTPLSAQRRRPRLARAMRRGALLLLLVALTLVWIAPFIFIVFTSFKTASDLFTGSPFALPQHWTWSNYGDSWQMANLGQAGLNSAIIAAIKVPLGLLFAAMAAFVFSRVRFRLRDPLFYLFLLGSMIPVQIAIVPLFSMLLNLHLLGTRAGVILPYLAFGMPFEIFVLRGFFNNIPHELDESARMDGCSLAGIFVRMIVPLSTPVLTALFILDFVATWNEFPIALVALPTSSSYTIPLGLQSFQSQFSTRYNLLMAAIVVATIPVLAVYAIFQRYFVAGLTSGALKG